MIRGRWAALTSKVESESESELREELLSYARLDEDWDGNGAKAPSQEAVNDAFTFLDGRPDDIPPPYPEEGTEGDVGVYWDFRDVQVFRRGDLSRATAHMHISSSVGCLEQWRRSTAMTVWM